MAKEFILVPKEKYESLIRHTDRQSNIMSTSANHTSETASSEISSDHKTDNLMRADIIKLIKGIVQSGNGGIPGKLITGPPGKRQETFQWLPY